MRVCGLYMSVFFLPPVCQLKWRGVYFKMAMTVLVLELQGGKKIRMSLFSSQISV